MGSTVQRIWRELLRNFDLYAVIVLALLLSVLGIIGTASIPVVLAGTLATLAIIAFSILKNRQADDKLENALDQMIKSRSGASALDFFQDRWDGDILAQRLESADDVSVLVGSNYRLIVRYSTLFGKLAQRGGRLRACLSNPQGSAIQMLSDRSGERRNAKTISALTTISLQELMQIGEDTSQAPMEIRLINHVPGLELIMIDLEKPDAIIFMTLAGFKQTARPRVTLLKKRDGKWFDFYQAYFENLWNWEGAEPFDPAKHLPNPQPPLSDPPA